MASTMLDAALQYAELNVPVFPCWGVERGRCLCSAGAACEHPGKHPIARCAPNGFKSATTDPAVIREWWTAYPDANIATPTTWCTVLDVDVRHGGDDILKALELEHGALPDTPQVLTGGGGTHYYFKPVNVPCSSGKVGEGLDVKAAGGYALMAPSRHASGNNYSDDLMCPLFETPLAPMPAWLLARASGSTSNGNGHAAPFHLPTSIREGQRNQRLYQLGRSLHAKGATEPEILEALIAVNRSRCTPPLGEREVKQAAREAATQPDRSDFRGAAARAETPIADTSAISEGQAAPAPDRQISDKPPGALVEVVDVADLIVRAFPEEPPLVGGGLIVPRSFNITAGAPKRGKSIIVCNREIRRAQGAPFLGFKTTPGRTLYFNAEIPEAQLKTRFVTMLAEGRADGGPVDPETLRGRLKTVTRRGLFIDEPAGYEEIRRLIEAAEPDLVTFDPLARFMSGEENSARDMGRLVAALDRLIQEYRLAVELVHHTGKPAQGDPRQGGHRLRGSSALFGAADAVVLLDRTADAWTLGFELRHAEEPGSMTLTRSSALWYSASGPPEKLVAAADLVKDISMKYSTFAGAIVEELKCSTPTAERLIRDAKKAGLVWQGNDGRYRRSEPKSPSKTRDGSGSQA